MSVTSPKTGTSYGLVTYDSHGVYAAVPCINKFTMRPMLFNFWCTIQCTFFEEEWSDGRRAYRLLEGGDRPN